MTMVFPEKLVVVRPKRRKFKIKVIGGDPDIDAIPAFAVPADSEKMVAKAKKWAETYSGSSGYHEEEVDNAPFSVRVYGYEHRGGGRYSAGSVVFKVVTEDGLTFDLRDEEALDMMIKEGVSPGGKINAKFIWSRKGAHMRMVREGKRDENLVKDILI